MLTTQEILEYANYGANMMAKNFWHKDTHMWDKCLNEAFEIYQYLEVQREFDEANREKELWADK